MAPALSRCSYRARWPASSLLGSGWRPSTGSAQMPCSHLPGEQMPLHLERRGEGRPSRQCTIASVAWMKVPLPARGSISGTAACSLQQAIQIAPSDRSGRKSGSAPECARSNGSALERPGVRRSLALKEHGALKSRCSEFFRDFDWAADAVGVEPRLSGLLDDPSDQDG